MDGGINRHAESLSSRLGEVSDSRRQKKLQRWLLFLQTDPVRHATANMYWSTR
jgi:hypothetical protein